MTAAPAAAAAPGRRERAKQEKLRRITEAAGALFAEHGIDDVTTQQIADAADIGTGTLFLYARSKGELLLLVQNASYTAALEEARDAVAGETDPVDAVLAIARPVVACNREHVENGRTYLREMVFGNPAEPHHARALEIVADTEGLTADALRRTLPGGVSDADADALARVVSAALFMSMAFGAATGSTTDGILADVRRQAAAVLAR